MVVCFKLPQYENMGHQNDFDPISKQGFSGALVATVLHSKTLLMWFLWVPSKDPQHWSIRTMQYKTIRFGVELF